MGKKCVHRHDVRITCGLRLTRNLISRNAEFLEVGTNIFGFGKMGTGVSKTVRKKSILYAFSGLEQNYAALFVHMVLEPLLETSLCATARLTWLCIVGEKYVRQWWHQRGVRVTCGLHLTRNLISQNIKFLEVGTNIFGFGKMCIGVFKTVRKKNISCVFGPWTKSCGVICSYGS